MTILTVCTLAFAVPAYSLMYGVEEFTWHLPRSIFGVGYWQVFGELEVLDEIESNKTFKKSIVYSKLYF